MFWGYWSYSTWDNATQSFSFENKLWPWPLVKVKEISINVEHSLWSITVISLKPIALIGSEKLPMLVFFEKCLRQGNFLGPARPWPSVKVSMYSIKKFVLEWCSLTPNLKGLGLEVSKILRMLRCHGRPDGRTAGRPAGRTDGRTD